jgi:hypothetical protein
MNQEQAIRNRLLKYNDYRYINRDEADYVTLTDGSLADALHHHDQLWESDNGAVAVQCDDDGNTGFGISTPDSLGHFHKASAGTVSPVTNTVVTVENSTDCFLNILTPANAGAGIYMGTAADNDYAYMVSDSAAGLLQLNTQTQIGLFIAGTQQIGIIDGVLKPTTDNDIDLATSALMFKKSFIKDVAYFGNKVIFTQTDGNEYIDSLADGYLDQEATTGIRFRINGTEQVVLTDGVLAPTTDNDIDIGREGGEFKDLYIDGTAFIDLANIDQLDVSGTSDLSGRVLLGDKLAFTQIDLNEYIDSLADGYLDSEATTGLRYRINGSQKMELNGTGLGVGIATPDGTIHAHTATAGAVTAHVAGDTLILEDSATMGMTMLSPDNTYGSVYWGSPTDGNIDGRITYGHSNVADATHRQAMTLWTNGAERMRINSDGTIGVLNKLYFTQTDKNEYIDSLADGYMDYGATTGHRFLNDIAVTGKVSSSTVTVTAAGPTDDLDVSGVNTVFVDTSGNNVTIGGFVGGVNGQEVRVVVIDPSNNTILEHNEGTGNQDIFLHAGVDETLDGHYGGWNLVCDGSNWYDESHAKHV